MLRKYNFARTARMRLLTTRNSLSIACAKTGVYAEHIQINNSINVVLAFLIRCSVVLQFKVIYLPSIVRIIANEAYTIYQMFQDFLFYYFNCVIFFLVCQVLIALIK